LREGTVLKFQSIPIRPLLSGTIAVLLTYLALGCRDSSRGTPVPVSGRITVDGQPLKADNVTVVFKPVKGNPTRYEPYGSVDEDGRYTLLLTPGQKGAEPGRYKVIVAAFEAPANERRPLLAPARNYRFLVNPRYGNPKTSGLEIEVVHSSAPGAYDLKLTK
jgi:hypothetical protein